MLPIVSLHEHPAWWEDAARWFSDKWNIPPKAYLDSFAEGARAVSGVPAWYLVRDPDGAILAGIGVIENDFHRRPDKTPNLCALYVEPAARGRGIARALLAHACAVLASHGVRDAYLITSHASFYERCGWEFDGMIEENDGSPIRLYHRAL